MTEYDVESAAGVGINASSDFSGGYQPSIRQLIITSITSGLSSITKAAGYQTNIGSRVYLCRTKIDKADIPAVTVWPSIESAVKMSGRNKCTMPVRVEALSIIGPNDSASSVAEQMLADLKVRIEHLTSNIAGGYCDHIEYYQGGPDAYPEPGDTIVNCSVIYNFVYKEKIGDPFTQ